MRKKLTDRTGRLALRRETLRALQTLTASDLVRVAGGGSQHCDTLGWGSKYCWW